MPIYPQRMQQVSVVWSCGKHPANDKPKLSGTVALKSSRHPKPASKCGKFASFPKLSVASPRLRPYTHNTHTHSQLTYNTQLYICVSHITNNTHVSVYLRISVCVYGSRLFRKIRYGLWDSG